MKIASTHFNTTIKRLSDSQLNGLLKVANKLLNIWLNGEQIEKSVKNCLVILCSFGRHESKE
jgi:hypothetical protein